MRLDTPLGLAKVVTSFEVPCRLYRVTGMRKALSHGQMSALGRKRRTGFEKAAEQRNIPEIPLPHSNRIFVTVCFPAGPRHLNPGNRFFIRRLGMTTPSTMTCLSSTTANPQYSKNASAVRLTSELRTEIRLTVASS